MSAEQTHGSTYFIRSVRVDGVSGIECTTIDEAIAEMVRCRDLGIPAFVTDFTCEVLSLEQLRANRHG